MLNWIRNIDIRMVAAGFSIFAAIAHGVVSGQLSLDHLFPAAWDPYIVAWLGVYLYVFPLIIGAHSYTALPWKKDDDKVPQPAMPKISPMAVIVAFLIVSLALLSMPFGARAADLSTAPLVKAIPPVQPACQTVNDCSGLFAGFNVQQQGGNFTLLSNGLGGVAQNDFAAGGQLGYEFYNGQWRLGGEVGFDYGLAPNGTLPGGGNHGLWSADALVCVGYSLAPLFGGSATGSTSTPAPALPAALANALMSPCLLVGGFWRPWGGGVATGARASALIAKGWTLDVDALHIDYNNANVNSILAEQTENLVRAGISYHFKP